jgi:hypothetical protein
MGKQLKPVELCSYTPAQKPVKDSKELMWFMMRNNSKARWLLDVFRIHQHEGYSML